MTHTPGEWTVYNDHPDEPGIHYVRTSPSLYHGEVAVLFGSNDNVRADAHLMAAAPAMLETLKTIRNYIDDPQRECPLPVEIASALRIAIAKAQGAT